MSWFLKFMAGFLAVVVVGWALFTWAAWMAAGSSEDFRELCSKLDAQPSYAHDWVCIKDGKVVYQDED